MSSADQSVSPALPAPGLHVPRRLARPATAEPPVSNVAVLLALGIVVCVFEGAGRKWLVQNPSFVVQGVFYFAKDLFLVAAALLAIASPSRSRAVQSIQSTLILVTVLIVLASAVNIGNVYVLGAMLSVRNTLFLPWLALTIAPGLRSRRDVDFLFSTIGVVAGIVAVLGALQFYLPAGHILNQQVSATQRALAEGGRIRATGTFTFISGMADLAMLAAWAGVSLMLRRPRQLMLGGMITAAGLACASAAVSRTGIIGALAVLLFSYLLLPSGRRDAVALLLLVALAGAYLAQDVEATDEIGLASSTINRFRTADSASERVLSLIYQPWAAMLEVPGGVGLGVGQSVGAAMQVQLPTTVALEVELARVVLEIGLVGLLAVLLLRGSVLWTLWQSCQLAVPTRLSPAFNPIRIASFVTVGMYFVNLSYFNHIAATFAWIIVAVALATDEIEARQAVRRPAVNAA